MPSARWPSFERILQIDKIYTSTGKGTPKHGRFELDAIPSELTGLIQERLGCPAYFRLKQTSHKHAQALPSHHCEKIKEAAHEAIVQILESKPSPETIDYDFVTRLNETFTQMLKGEGGGGEVTLQSMGDVQLFDILEIVGYAYPGKLQETRGFKIWRNTISDVRGLCRVLCIKGLNFKTVDLQHNDFGIEGAKALASAIRENASLTSVNLSHSQLGPEGAKELAPAICKSTSITSINLNDNYVGPEGAKALAPAIRKLTSINLRLNHLGLEGAEALAPAIRDSASLTSINLRLNHLGLEGAKALAPAIRDSASLTSIDLEHNQLGAEGAKALAPALRDSASVTCLDVRHNGISGDGASQLSAAVLGNPKMENFNEIPIKEMRANSLIELDLSGKEVGVVGCMVVAGLLPVMASLTKISLANNNLGEEGTKLICEAVKSNTTIKELDLSGGFPSYNNIGGPAGAKHVANMLKVTASLTSINLRSNDIGEEGSLRKAVEGRRIELRL